MSKEDTEVVEEETELSVEEQITAVIEARESNDAEEEQKPDETAAEEISEGEEDDSETATADTDDDTEQEGAADVDAPDQWSAEDKTTFEAIPEEHRGLVIEARKSLERGYDKKFKTLAGEQKGFATEKNEYDQIVNLVAPFEAQLNAAGLDRVGGIRALVGAQTLLQTNPEAGLTQLFRQYAAHDPSIIQRIAKAAGVAVQGPDTEADEYVDPQVQSLQQQVSQIQANTAAQHQFTQQQQQAAYNTQVQVFMEATDEGGVLVHPHFAKVELEMADMIRGLQSRGEQVDLEAVYKNATRANPETYQEVQAKLDTARLAKDDASRKETVKKAKNSSRDAPTRRAAPKTPTQVSDKITDSVAAAFDNHFG